MLDVDLAALRVVEPAAERRRARAVGVGVVDRDREHVVAPEQRSDVRESRGRVAVGKPRSRAGARRGGGIRRQRRRVGRSCRGQRDEDSGEGEGGGGGEGG